MRRSHRGIRRAHPLLDAVHLGPQRDVARQGGVVEGRVGVLQVLHGTRRRRRGEALLDELLGETALVEHHRPQPGDQPLARRLQVEVHQPVDALGRRRPEDGHAGPAGAVQQQRGHPVGVVQRQPGGDVGPHRVADDADPVQPEGVEESDDGVLGDLEVVALVGLRPGRGTEADLVDDDRPDPSQLRQVGTEVGPARDPRTGAVQEDDRRPLAHVVVGQRQPVDRGRTAGRLGGEACRQRHAGRSATISSAMSMSWSSWPPTSLRSPARMSSSAPETPYRWERRSACLRKEE
jgi:hypothetical protein